VPISRLDDVQDVQRDRELALEETSDERFDRTAFAMRALDLLRPSHVRIAVCEGRRLRVETGRLWGRGPGARWAVLAVPPKASRRAIATAVAELAGSAVPYAWDVLFGA
jgi:hypothetical protein